MNRLWKTAHWLICQKMRWIRKLGRILELFNHIVCSCSVSARADIERDTIFFTEV